MHHILSTRFNNPNLPLRPIPGFQDDFTGGGGGYTDLGRTNDGKLWEYPIPGGSLGPGWFQRADNTATALGRSTLAIVDGASSDGYLETRFAAVPTDAQTQPFGLAFRYTDPDNYLFFAQQASGLNIRLARVENGVIRQIANNPYPPRRDDTIGVQFEGETITCFYNGEPIIQRESDHNLHGTKHGLYNLYSEDNSSPWFEYCTFVA